MLRKYNTDLQELCYRYLWITTNYLHTNSIPLWGKVFSQSHNFLEKSLLCTVSATYSKAHPALLGEQQKEKQDNLGLRLSPDSDAPLVYWHVCTALRFYLHIQTTLLLALWQGTADHCWDTLLPGEDRPICGPYTESFPSCTICLQMLIQIGCSCKSDITQSTWPDVLLTIRKSFRSSHPHLAWNAWEK